MRNNKGLLFAIFGIVLIIVAIDQFIADVTKIHFALNSWISFFILIIGVFFLERANKIRKENKT